jgi:hypothetical protein
MVGILIPIYNPGFTPVLVDIKESGQALICPPSIFLFT